MVTALRALAPKNLDIRRKLPDQIGQGLVPNRLAPTEPLGFPRPSAARTAPKLFCGEQGSLPNAPAIGVAFLKGRHCNSCTRRMKSIAAQRRQDAAGPWAIRVPRLSLLDAACRLGFDWRAPAALRAVCQIATVREPQLVSGRRWLG